MLTNRDYVHSESITYTYRKVFLGCWGYANVDSYYTFKDFSKRSKGKMYMIINDYSNIKNFEQN